MWSGGLHNEAEGMCYVCVPLKPYFDSLDRDLVGHELWVEWNVFLNPHHPLLHMKWFVHLVALEKKPQCFLCPDKEVHSRELFVLRVLIKKNDLIKCKKSCCWVGKTSNVDTVGFLAGIGFFLWEFTNVLCEHID